ncbi:MAG: T9SS type A sorting domain-containing protein, partial [Candidatus Krumholzibacteria bacterium]|nr:T9SS type A sorting domain-containing protein [Candidatus Krumholzibacteria bacterium]
MRKQLLGGAIAFACVLSISLSIHETAEARKIDRAGIRIMQALHENENPVEIDQGARGLQLSASVDTYCLVWYDFEAMNWQGWTKHDNTAQIDTFFHVDDFAGLGGGEFGGLTALEGTKSMWCGTRPAGDPGAKAPDWYLCSWELAPGYGNNWSQALDAGVFAYVGYTDVSFKIRCDTEPEYDFVTFEAAPGYNERIIAEYTGMIDTTVTYRIYAATVSTKLRFKFTSDHAWSDQDGLWNTDGACIIDSITVSDLYGLINFEDFEDEPVGATRSNSGFWRGNVENPYGSYAGLSCNLFTDDPCGENVSTQIVFFHGSAWPSVDPPGLFNTPFCIGPGGLEAPCQDEIVISPVIDLGRYSSGCDENQDTPIPPASLPNMGGLVLKYSTYSDLPLQNLVFDVWGVRSIDESGCPGLWRDYGYWYFIYYKGYMQSSAYISDLVDSDHIQVMLGVVDMCDSWFDSYGNCANHTPAPWYDNVRLYTYDSSGPQWSTRDLDLFQDNFPSEEFDLESFVRIDAANDLRANDDPVIDPGDSAVVSCSALMAGGLDTLGTGEERIYCHVWAEYIGDDGLKSDLYGPSLEGTYGTYVSDDGGQWTVFLMPTAITGAGNEAEDKYMIDLNDSLFTRGYEIKYYFKAFDLDGNFSTHPENAESGGWIYEVTCLPTLNSGVLFVDDYHGRGTDDGTVQIYWDNVFRLLPGHPPDRYDVNSPSSLVGNGPGSRAKNYHLRYAYETIFWDSGNLNYGTITEGTAHSDKSNDAQMLVNWLDLSEHKVGLWVMGDHVAGDLDGSPASSALALLHTCCGVDLVNNSYFELTGGWGGGGVTSPLVTGVSGGVYDGITYYVFGGCPVLNGFDVLGKIGLGAYSLKLPDYNSSQYYIGITASQLNSAAYPLRTSWIGHSMMYVRNEGAGYPIRDDLFSATLDFFEMGYYYPCDTGDTPAVSSLAQNYPNPFNPATTLKFDLALKGHVSLKIYNVAGQLVRTLVSEERDAGRYNEVWDGRSNSGSKVASGVYFYRMKTGSF